MRWRRFLGRSVGPFIGPKRVHPCHHFFAHEEADYGRVLAFTDSQLRAVWAAAGRLPVEKRGVFLQRVVARLELHRGFTDADLDDAVRAALTGLIQSAA